ncbi:MAG TPA: PQQ-binding-like beta-propeller repeat protein, partial [Candidatus Acidoferrum sp.]|nr:PQQ-binding-like beta-propeller repeat protein [Candidatus Acidoferrum sp.]
IMQGILYYTMYPGSSTNPAGWAAVDLQTGQTLWTKNTTDVLVCGQILDYVTPNQYGGLTYLWSEPQTSSALGAPSSTLEMWDAMTGNYILTITGNPTMSYSSLTEDEHGGLALYYVNSTDNTLDMWNSTRCINLASGGSIYGAGPSLADSWQWRPPQGASIDFGLGIQWSVPLAENISGNSLIDYANGLFGLSMAGVESGVVLLYEELTPMSETMPVFSYSSGWIVEAGYSAATGQQLWITNRTETPYSIVALGASQNLGYFTMGNGVSVEITQSTLSATGYSLTTGKQLWGPITLPNANPFDSLGLQSVVANGKMYLWGYGGDVYAIDMTNGTIVWHYKTPSGGFESPYGTEPLWVFTVGTIADGKLFVPEGHMYSPPLFHNAQQLALNITDGSVVWNIDAFDTTSAPAISDGIMTTLNAYDNQIYAYGMGPSKTTVSAPGVGITTSTPVTITGTVTDISAGSKQEAIAANFPNGLPCISDASMSQFMEAAYMQQQMPTNLTGVPVTISVTDSNGNSYDIGTVQSNANGFYSLTWTPTIQGNFTITATFAGTQSYYGSSANTAFYASPTSTAVATSQPVNLVSTQNYIMVGIIATIVAIAIVGAILSMLILRKRP